MSQEGRQIKNLKISKEVHDILKRYCDKNGIKMYRFLEKLIIEKCKEKKDIYGED
jgi:hypothetical protein